MTQKVSNVLAFGVSILLIGLAVNIWLPTSWFTFTNPSQQRAQAQQTPEVTSDTVDISELQSRPVFQQSRRYKAEVQEEVSDNKPLIPEVPIVKGLAIAEAGNRFVFIQSSKDGIVYQLREGELLDGEFEIRDINLNEILLVDKQGNEIILEVNA